MTTDTTLTGPFDQQLYDAAMTEKPGDVVMSSYHHWLYEQGVRTALRLVAERAATAPTDESPVDAYEAVSDILSHHFEVDVETEAQMVWWGKLQAEIVEAVRAALQPAPVIPEWVEEVVVCVLGKPIDADYGSYQREIEGSGATLPEALEALTAAIEKAGETP